MFNATESEMNPTPRSQLTPAERDAAMFEASRLRAMSLRREAIDHFWNAISRVLHSLFHLRKGA